MSSTYPNTRRNSRTGSQDAPSRAPRRSGERGYPQAPANDNPSHGYPANDNSRMPSRRTLYNVGRLSLSALKRFVPVASKFVPYLGNALTLLEAGQTALDLLRNRQKMNFNMSDWVQTGTECGSQGGLNYNVGQLPCGYKTTQLKTKWLAGLGKMKYFSQGSSSYWSANFYKQFWDGITYINYTYSSRYTQLASTHPLTNENTVLYRNDCIEPFVEISPQLKALGQAVSLMPQYQPILAPAIQPQPLPYAMQAHKFNSESIQGYQAGYFPLFVGKPSGAPSAPPSPAPAVNEIPYVAPPIAIYNGKKGKSSFALRGLGNYHKLKRPNKGEKEFKARTVQAFGAVSPYINPLTESIDIINAIYKDLPEQYRPRFKNTPFEKYAMRPDEKLVAIYKNFDKINWLDAIQDVAVSQAQDKIWATLGKTGGEVSRSLGKPVGTGINKIIGNLPKIN